MSTVNTPSPSSGLALRAIANMTGSVSKCLKVALQAKQLQTICLGTILPFSKSISYSKRQKYKMSSNDFLYFPKTENLVGRFSFYFQDLHSTHTGLQSLTATEPLAHEGLNLSVSQPSLYQ